MPSKRTILITGCSSGCGLDAAITLKARGWRVFASCRKPEDCARLEAQGFDSPCIDYADEATILSGWQEVMRATDGTLDALYNNGAQTFLGATEDIPTAGLRELFETDFFGWHTLTQLAIKAMRRQGTRGAGHIIQHSSGYGLVGGAFRMCYCAAKHALEAHSQCLREELADTDIHVCLINTGFIRTKIRENARPAYTKWIAPLVEGSSWRSYYKAKLEVRLFGPYVKDPLEGEPPIVTKEVIKALESSSPWARYYVGREIWFLALMVRLLPSQWVDAVMNKFSQGIHFSMDKAAVGRVLHPSPHCGGRRAGGNRGRP